MRIYSTAIGKSSAFAVSPLLIGNGTWVGINALVRCVLNGSPNETDDHSIHSRLGS